MRAPMSFRGSEATEESGVPVTLRNCRFLAALGMTLLLAATAAAQDTRTVTEPVRPRACVTLRAALVPVADSTLKAEDERKLDTDRIQRAVDGCAAGRAVVLATGGSGSAFLSGPLRLRESVALVVDSG